MKFESVSQAISKSLQSGETLSPFLFLWNNLEILHSELTSLSHDVLGHYNIPKTSIIKLEDDWDSLKIDSIRALLRSSSVRASYDFQIFIIENISRLTLASSNSMLKFLEEPGKGNIIFLSNASESGILDTILSRVTPIQSSGPVSIQKNGFFQELLSNIQTPAWKQALLSYVYGAKLERGEYIEFLQTILTSNIISPQQMQDLSDDVLVVSNNNVLPKYILDKWILAIL